MVLVLSTTYMYSYDTVGTGTWYSDESTELSQRTTEDQHRHYVMHSESRQDRFNSHSCATFESSATLSLYRNARPVD